MGKNFYKMFLRANDVNALSWIIKCVGVSENRTVVVKILYMILYV